MPTTALMICQVGIRYQYAAMLPDGTIVMPPHRMYKNLYATHQEAAKHLYFNVLARGLTQSRSPAKPKSKKMTEAQRRYANPFNRKWDA